jgi:hypothetical protein
MAACPELFGVVNITDSIDIVLKRKTHWYIIRIRFSMSMSGLSFSRSRCICVSLVAWA